MPDKMKCKKGKNGRRAEPAFYNDQPGENAGEGRMMKAIDEKKGKKQSK